MMDSTTLASDVLVPSTDVTAITTTTSPNARAVQTPRLQTSLSLGGQDTSSPAPESGADPTIEPASGHEEEGTMQVTKLGDIEKTVVTYVTIEEVSSTPVAELSPDQTFSVVTAG